MSRHPVAREASLRSILEPDTLRRLAYPAMCATIGALTRCGAQDARTLARFSFAALRAAVRMELRRLQSQEG